METGVRVVIEGAYWIDDSVYADVDGEPYLVDTGAEVSMTRKALDIVGHLSVQLADGEVTTLPYGLWKGVVWMKGPNNLITMKDLRELRKSKKSRQPMRKKLARVQNEILHFHHVARPSRHQGWYKVVDVPAVIIEKVEESDLSLEGKARLRGVEARFCPVIDSLCPIQLLKFLLDFMKNRMRVKCYLLSFNSTAL